MTASPNLLMATVPSSVWGGAAFALFTGLASLGYALWRRAARRRRDRETCPKCLAEGTLVLSDPVPGSPDRLVQCRNEALGEGFAACEFEFPEYYRDFPKLALTMLGTPASGKSLWAATLYHQFRRGAYPPALSFTAIRGDASERFDRIVSQILNDRIGPAATQVSTLPDPLVFEFRGRRRCCRRAHCLVNLFDFAGEVSIHHDLGSPLRRRQLRSEGYVFVLDPTQPPDAQADAIARFAENSARARNLPRGAPIDAPLAICITKLDLLVTLPDYQPGGYADQLYDGLREIDPTGMTSSNAVVEARSELARRFLPHLFPGWEMLHVAEGYFGRRWKLFPLTPIGLNDVSAESASDLARRMFDPYGVCEPLLWLLEQNGLSVLE